MFKRNKAVSVHAQQACSGVPPPHLLMQIANNPSGDDFVASFVYTRRAILDSLADAGVDFGEFERILDFGCGVGRFLFAMRPELRPHQKLFGCDVDRECATWCRQNIDFAEIAHTAIDPPLPYADESFDFVYALSVFTHLSFDLQFAWAMELHRILRPGGVIFFTTHGEIHLPMTLAGRHAQSDYALLGEDGLLWSFSARRERADEGQREVAVIHSRSAIDHVFSEFQPLYHRRISNLAAGQSLSIRRRAAGSRKLLAATPAQRGGVLSTSNQAAEPLVFALPAFSGAGRFRFLLSFDEPWHAANALECAAEVFGSDGRSMQRGVVNLPFNSFAGARHFAPLVVDVVGDGAPCEVAWTVSWAGQWRPRDAVGFRISRARLESYRDARTAV
jgi:SAM-dependent methyltransferase